jgi:hypothetical protein
MRTRTETIQTIDGGLARAWFCLAGNFGFGVAWETRKGTVRRLLWRHEDRRVSGGSESWQIDIGRLWFIVARWNRSEGAK